ncbi:cathepsin L1 [Galendromus occidentalis]|uniref:Cathepsin L1 n=1 Tax=Galendromus occidentalis TaxID=34638 RepID=A0AAJ7WJ95_9ACAR|nr:cathepsin L1 [Galendromus occidentalis]
MLRTTAILVALLGLASANWDLYKKVHGKSYGHDEEHFRRQLFYKSVAKINAHNLRHDLGLTTYRMGLNKFTDMTSEEFRNFKGLKFDATKTKRNGTRFQKELLGEALPTQVDWREKGYVTPVKNQGQCGSCWAFSTTGSLEGQHFKATGKLVSLSEQNLVDCSRVEGNNGCNGGLMDNGFTYIQQNGGIDTEESYPYTGKDGDCAFNENSVGARVKGFVDVPQRDEAALQAAVASVGPVSVAIDASNDSFQYYKEGVYDEPSCSFSQLDHGVLVVGYGTENGVDYWLVKNSWGPTWGQDGYIKMMRNKENQCGIASMASYPTV